MPFRNLAIIAVAAAVSLVCLYKSSRNRYAATIVEAMEIIEANALEEVEPYRLFEGAMDGMVSKVDEHSDFIPRGEYARTRENLDQRFGGVGIQVEMDEEAKRVKVVVPMPNTPALVQAGVTGLYALPAVNAQEKENAGNILAAVGSVLWVAQEDMLHTVTAISGSGPGYVFYFIEAMQQAGRELGLTADQVRQLSLQTFLGAVKLAEQSNEAVETLRLRVTSKGGITERAIQYMEENDVKQRIVRGIHAASKRSHELSDEFGEK